MRLGEFTEEFILTEARRQHTEGQAHIEVEAVSTSRRPRSGPFGAASHGS
jgi:hypothetical protein